MGYYRIAQRTQLNFRNPLLKLVQHHSSESLYLRKYTRIPFLTFFCRICLWFQRKINKKKHFIFLGRHGQVGRIGPFNGMEKEKIKKKTEWKTIKSKVNSGWVRKKWKVLQCHRNSSIVSHVLGVRRTSNILETATRRGMMRRGPNERVSFVWASVSHRLANRVLADQRLPRRGRLVAILMRQQPAIDGQSPFQVTLATSGTWWARSNSRSERDVDCAALAFNWGWAFQPAADQSAEVIAETVGKVKIRIRLLWRCRFPLARRSKRHPPCDMKVIEGWALV